MLLSMTGFGSAQGQINGVHYSVEVRSVNNRYFKAIVKLPEAWSGTETEVEKLLSRRIKRGTVTIKVRMRLTDDRAAHRVNVAAMKSYLSQLELLQVKADPTLRIDLVALLQLPGVCEPPPEEELRQTSHDGFVALICEALDGLIEMRQREGQALVADLLAQCDVVEENLSTVVKRAPEVLNDYHQRLASRAEELANAGRANIDADVLAREVAIFADRCDLAEEVSRLGEHLKQFRLATETVGPAGRKLDFIAQEMLREANTIASKANDAEIARCVVEIKTAIDRVKEQAANVE